MIRFNPDTERKLKEDLANVGKANQGYNIYATVKGSANHRRIGTLDPKRTVITFDGTNNLAPHHQEGGVGRRCCCWGCCTGPNSGGNYPIRSRKVK